MSVSSRVLLAAFAISLAACSSGPRGSATVEMPPATVAETAPQAAPAEPSAGAPAAVDSPKPVRDAAPAPQPVARQPFDAARAGLAVAVPGGWKTKRRDLALIYEGPMRVPSVVLWQPEAQTLDAAVKRLPEELRAPLGAVRITKQPQTTTVAGYDAYVVEGTGRAEGFPMRWRATVVDAEHLTIMLGLTPSFFWNANRGRVVAFERGVTRAGLETAGRASQETAAR